MMSYKSHMKGWLASDDWMSMYQEGVQLKDQRKVLYLQPYNPHASEERDRPFILVIQDEWMLQMALRFKKQFLGY